MPDTQHVYVVSEVRDSEVRRIHGYYASLNGAFAYCEAEERTKPLIDTVRFELFPVPGGTQWLIHTFYGPEDTCPETSDFVIRQVDVVPDDPAVSPAGVVQLPHTNQDACVSPPAVWIDGHPLLEAIAAAVWEQCSTEGTSLVVDDPRNIAVAAASVLPAPVDRAAVLREAADGFDRHVAQILESVGDKAVFVAKALRDQAAVWSEAAETLRRLAAEANPEPAAEDRPVAYRSYGTRALYCVICARQEDRCEPVTQVDEKDVCSFCGGNLLAVASRTLGGVIAKYLKETP